MRLLRERLRSTHSLTRTKIDFLWISFIHLLVIVPSVTRTRDNSSIPLTWSDFCFLSDHFYNFTLDNSNHPGALAKTNTGHVAKTCHQTSSRSLSVRSPSLWMVHNIKLSILIRPWAWTNGLEISLDCKVLLASKITLCIDLTYLSLLIYNLDLPRSLICFRRGNPTIRR